MQFDPFKHHRRSMRLRGYDYTQGGAYFVTICVEHRQCLFGEVYNGAMDLNEWGIIADECWLAIPEHFPNVELGEYVIMPNHMHGIVVMDDTGVMSVGARRDVGSQVGAQHDVGARHASPLHTNGFKHSSLSAVIGSYKSAVTKRINDLQNSRGAKIWQRNYYDHIIRDERQVQCIAKYIYENPMNWQTDIDHPENIKRQTLPRMHEDYWRNEWRHIKMLPKVLSWRHVRMLPLLAGDQGIH